MKWPVLVERTAEVRNLLFNGTIVEQIVRFFL